LWQRRGCAVLLVTPDVKEAVLLTDRVLVMDDGGHRPRARCTSPYAEADGHLVLGPRTGYADHEARARTRRVAGELGRP
jgi:ABC-type nitrate/sulfonate/bicarbonate transport system ATPase subunit